jgi:hypothetical protein
MTTSEFEATIWPEGKLVAAKPPARIGGTAR